MTVYNLDPHHFENATITLELTGNETSLILSGDIDMRDTSVEFLPYLLKVHDELIKNRIKKLNLNLLKLTFMNSNGIKSLINWIMKLGELSEQDRYKIHILASNDIAWQESTLPVLCKLFPDSIVIEQA